MIEPNDARVLVCIPAYNEARSITDIVVKAKKYGSEVIVYDDGSDDNTSEFAGKSGAVVIRDAKNRGYGVAIRELFLISRYRDADIMVTIDADGQHDPDQIPGIIQPILANHCDIVIGSRFLNNRDREKVPTIRMLGIKFITKFTHMISYNNLTDAQNGFRAYSRRALAELDLRNDGMSISIEILQRAKEKKLSMTEVPVTVYYDVESPSTYNSVRHGMGILLSLVRFSLSRHPLGTYGLPNIVLYLLSSYLSVNAS